MRYRLNTNMRLLQDGERSTDGESLIEVISSKEYKERHDKKLYKGVSVETLFHPNYCKADVLKDCIIGSFVIPNKEKLLEEGKSFGYHMTNTQLLFIDDTGTINRIIQHISEIQMMEETNLAHFFFEVLECLVKDDVRFLQDYEKTLSELEESLLDNEMGTFAKDILNIRKELLILQSYYQQLADISDTLMENQNHMFAEEDCRLFGLYSNRVGRLYDNIHMLKEYTLQLRELHQSQIDVRQNAVMKFLTIVTTIFMPLSLVAGWYGMNFVNMPELHHPYGYVVIIAISAITILIEVWVLKVKKWFN